MTDSVLNFPTLKYRQYRGDMTELFKIIKGVYDPKCVPYFDFVVHQRTQRAMSINSSKITVIMT